MTFINGVDETAPVLEEQTDAAAAGIKLSKVGATPALDEQHRLAQNVGLPSRDKVDVGLTEEVRMEGLSGVDLGENEEQVT